MRALTFLCLLAACSPSPVVEIDEIFSGADDGERRVFCAVNLDAHARTDLDSVLDGLERAHARGEIIHLYAHSPGTSVPIDKLEAVLARADALGMAHVTYPELDAPPPPGGGLALSFDDADIASWYGARELLAAYGARVTFFVTRYDLWSAREREQLHELEQDGHAVGGHGFRHLNGPAYVTDHGLAAFMADEVVPSLELLRADGFAARVYAYPFGRRTGEIDAAVLAHVDRVRSVSFSIEGLVSDPCPE